MESVQDRIRPGSSPPARGTRGACCNGNRVRRFIPACAGNTLAKDYGTSAVSVHPRLRGEHGFGITLAQLCHGSSPPARGTPRNPLRQNKNTRFIPACAGNTLNKLKAHYRPPVHPRLRGEHATAYTTGASASGSSPPARGTLRTHLGEIACRRFIPACAGNTASENW